MDGRLEAVLPSIELLRLCVSRFLIDKDWFSVEVGVPRPSILVQTRLIICADEVRRRLVLRLLLLVLVVVVRLLDYVRWQSGAVGHWLVEGGQVVLGIQHLLGVDVHAPHLFNHCY